MDVTQIENSGNFAIRKLRADKLKNGLPFMINSKDLPTNEAYLEYPCGRIALITITKESRDFIVLRNLTPHENSIIRAKFNLFNLES
ncbi:hypothetical protein EGT74_17145 [Chitinophaga lutea]|uniref:Uncharacterized protein n=1 Tax=Chitinophaga lutea TaxID=2488634 RepID=A0A3N4PPX8_9BACT|nr:hypothetical protein EGT74_17145 [Chitinophaga lutea]